MLNCLQQKVIYVTIGIETNCGNQDFITSVGKDYFSTNGCTGVIAYILIMPR